MTTGIGTAPIGPLDVQAVAGLMEERIANSPAWALGRDLAPIRTMPLDEGSYVTDGTVRVLDLQANPDALSEVSLDSTEYSGLETDLGTQSYRCKRYPVGKATIPYRRVRKLQRETGYDYEADVVSRFDPLARAKHMALVASAIGTAGNYASGYSADPGNITSASFGLRALCYTVAVALEDAEAWFAGMPLDITVSEDVWRYLGLLTEVKNSARGAYFADEVQSAAAYTDFFRSTDLGEGVTVRRATGYYRNAAGTATRFLSGKIAFTVPYSGNSKHFVSTIVPENSGDLGGVLSVREEEVPAMPGRIVYGDAYFDVHIASNTAGYLAHTLLS